MLQVLYKYIDVCNICIYRLLNKLKLRSDQKSRKSFLGNICPYKKKCETRVNLSFLIFIENIE